LKLERGKMDKLDALNWFMSSFALGFTTATALWLFLGG